MEDAFLARFFPLCIWKHLPLGKKINSFKSFLQMKGPSTYRRCFHLLGPLFWESPPPYIIAFVLINIRVSIIRLIVNFTYHFALQFFNKHSIFFLCIIFYFSLSLSQYYPIVPLNLNYTLILLSLVSCIFAKLFFKTTYFRATSFQLSTNLGGGWEN